MESKNTMHVRPSVSQVAQLLKSSGLPHHYFWDKRPSKWSEFDEFIWQGLKSGKVLDKDSAKIQLREQAKLNKIELKAAEMEGRIKSDSVKEVKPRIEKIKRPDKGTPELKEFQTRNVVQVLRVFDGKVYDTALEAATAIGISASQMVRYLDAGVDFQRLGARREKKS